MLVPSVVSVQHASGPSEPSPLPHKPQSKSTLCSRELISTPRSPEPVSRNCARTSSDQPQPQSTVSSQMPRLTSRRFTRSFSSVDPPVFRKSKNSSPTTSTARSLTSQSTPMRLLHTALPSKPPFSPVTLLQSPPPRSSCSMLRHCPSVSRLLVAK